MIVGGLKWCFKCKATKPVDEFYKNRYSSDGRQSACKACGKSSHAEYQRKNRSKIMTTRRDWMDKNVLRIEATTKAWKAANADKIEIYRRNWEVRNRFSNRGLAIGYGYRLIHPHQQPSWLTDEQKLQLIDIHFEKYEANRRTRVKHHVDHIIPLRGKTVSGLHVPWNLRVIPAKDNIAKGNRL